MALYLWHFDPAFGHARHYLGYAPDAGAGLESRLAEHLAGQGSNLTRRALAAGCVLRLARIWESGDLAREWSMKGYRKGGPRVHHGGLRRYCRICSPIQRPDPVLAKWQAWILDRMAA